MSDATERFVTDSVFRRRGPSTGVAELTRLAHILTHHEFVHARHAHNSPFIGAINRFSLSKADPPNYNKLEMVESWRDKILSKMYDECSPKNAKGKGSWKKRGIKHPNILSPPKTPDSYLHNSEFGTSEDEWNNQSWGMRDQANTDSPALDDTLVYLKTRLSDVKFSVAGLGGAKEGDATLLTEEEQVAICDAVRANPVLLGRESKFDNSLPEDQLRSKHMEKWHSLANEKSLGDTWWDSLARWAGRDGGLEEIFLTLSKGGPNPRTEPLLIFRLKQLVSASTHRRVSDAPPEGTFVLPTPPSAEKQEELQKTVEVQPRSSDVGIGTPWFKQETTHLLLKLGYYVGETVTVEASTEARTTYKVADGNGTIVYGYTELTSSKETLIDVGGFARWRLESGGKSWYDRELVSARYEELGEPHPGDEYTGLWRLGERHDQNENAASTMSFVDGGKYVGMWKADKPHGNGTYYHPNGWKWQGEWDDGLRTAKLSLFYTPRALWAKRGRKGFWPYDAHQFKTCETYALEEASENVEGHEHEMDPDGTADDEIEARGGPVEAAKRIVVQLPDYPSFVGAKFKDKVILRASDEETFKAIQKAFEEVSPAELCKGRDTNGYVWRDGSKRYHEIVPVSVFDVDYTYHAPVRHAYEEAVFRVQENRERWDAMEKAWYASQKDEELRKPKWVEVKYQDPTTKQEIKYVSKNQDRKFYNGPRSAKFPIFKASPSNPEGAGVRILPLQFEKYYRNDPNVVPVKIAVEASNDYEDDSAVITRYYRRPHNLEEANSADAEMLEQVITRTDKLYGLKGEKLFETTNALSQEPPLKTKLNEKLLYHSTSSSKIESILANGIDGYYAGKGIFGAVCYFADDPGKCDQYARLSRDNSSRQSTHFDVRMRRRFGIHLGMFKDAVRSLTSGLLNEGTQDIFYMFVCRACLGCPMLLDQKGCCVENAAGNVGSWEAHHVKQHTVDSKTKVLKANPAVRMPCWVTAKWMPPGNTEEIKMQAKRIPTIPDIPTNTPTWTQKNGHPLSSSDFITALKTANNNNTKLRSQVKFNEAYDSLIGYGWGTRCGAPQQARMRFREFMLARKDPRHPSSVAARPTHLVAYKRMGSWPARYEQGKFRLDEFSQNDKPAHFGSQWVRSYDSLWDKTVNDQHIDGPLTATENYPRLEPINNGVATTEPYYDSSDFD